MNAAGSNSFSQQPQNLYASQMQHRKQKTATNFNKGKKVNMRCAIVQPKISYPSLSQNPYQSISSSMSLQPVSFVQQQTKAILGSNPMARGISSDSAKHTGLKSRHGKNLK